MHRAVLVRAVAEKYSHYVTAFVDHLGQPGRGEVAVLGSEMRKLTLEEVGSTSLHVQSASGCWNGVSNPRL